MAEQWVQIADDYPLYVGDRVAIAFELGSTGTVGRAYDVYDLEQALKQDYPDWIVVSQWDNLTSPNPNFPGLTDEYVCVFEIVVNPEYEPKRYEASLFGWGVLVATIMGLYGVFTIFSRWQAKQGYLAKAELVKAEKELVEEKSKTVGGQVSMALASIPKSVALVGLGVAALALITGRIVKR